MNLCYLDGLTMPEASLRMVSLVCLANFIPSKLMADSNMFLATFGSVGKARFPTWQFALMVRCSNLTSTVGSRISTLFQQVRDKIMMFVYITLIINWKKLEEGGNKKQTSGEEGSYRSILFLSFLKNFSLSSSATLKTRSIKSWRSLTPSFRTSTSLWTGKFPARRGSGSLTDCKMLVLRRS